MEVKIESVKCACNDCVCVIKTAEAITKDGKLYCSDNCADEHSNSQGCNHAGCNCSGK